MEGKLEEAEKELRRLLALAPQGTDVARLLLGQLLSGRGMFHEAVRHLSEAFFWWLLRGRLL